MTRWLVVALLLLVLPAPAFAAAAVSVSASASSQSPYQNQSILYTVRVVAHAGVSNVSLSELGVANAIVERQGEPQVQRSAENGIPVNLVYFHFIITPLQPGSVTIPPVTLKGEIETSDDAPSDPFGGSFMANMLRAMNAISSLAGGQSFTATSNTTVLNVRPPVAGLRPWLPLASLKITEDALATQSVHVGDLISRKITLSANGAVGSQLPDVEDQQNHGDFRVYTDKPTMGETIDKTGAILAWRTESFSLVPQRPGLLVLPAVTVSWWNVVTDKIATAELPRRTVKVLPGGAAQSPAADTVDLARVEGAPGGTPAMPSKPPSGISNFGAEPWEIVAAALIVSLLSITFWWVARWRKFRFAGNDRGSVARKATPRRQESRSGSTSVAALKHVREPEELRAFLQSYAHEHWGTARNASLEKIFATRKVSGSERGDVDVLVEGISASLYAGRPVDIEDLKKRCQRLIVASKKKRTGHHKGNQQLVGLNPE